MDLTPLVPADRQVIERYAPSGFRIAGVIWHGPVLVFPDTTIAWTVSDAAALTSSSLQAVVDHGDVQVLLLGLGRRMATISHELRATMRRAGIVLETMDTGAACRTYNMLMAEDRRVAAALIPPV